MSNDLEALRARKAARDAARDAEAESLETQALELEDKYETAGKRVGKDFAVVITSAGVFVVRAPEFVVGKRFSDVEKKTTEDVMQFASACVLHPEQGIARAVMQEHGGVAWKLAGACLQLYEASADARRGK